MPRQPSRKERSRISRSPSSAIFVSPAIAIYVSQSHFGCHAVLLDRAYPLPVKHIPHWWGTTNPMPRIVVFTGHKS
jgi:hypothetical protein